MPKIRAAEKAWIVYRDAFMEAMYPAKNKQVEYGSVYPMEANDLLAELARRHIVDLKELSRQFTNGPNGGVGPEPKVGR